MKFMTTWSLKPEHYAQANNRFLTTGGGPPPGVTMLGRWHALGHGYVLSEASDVKPLYEWLHQWSDLLEFTIVPVMDDAEAAAVLQKTKT